MTSKKGYMRVNLDEKETTEQPEIKLEDKKSSSTSHDHLKTPYSRYKHDLATSSDNNQKELIIYAHPNSGLKKKNKKRVIFFDGKLKRISNINTQEETFKARFHFYLTWLATEEEKKSFDDFEAKNEVEEEWKPEWVPNVYFANVAEGDVPEPVNFKMKKGCEMVFAERMELEWYPFDCQDFSIIIEMDHTYKECDLVPFPRIGEYFKFDSTHSSLQEWYLSNILLEFGYTKQNRSRSNKIRPLLCIKVKGRRIWSIAMQHLIVTFCMFFLGLATFFISPEEIGDRLGYSITLLLSDIAVLQLLQDKLPDIPYLTLLDYYMYSCFIYLVLITAWACFATLVHSDRYESRINMWVGLGFLILFVVMHIIFWTSVSLYVKNYEKKKLLLFNDELDEHYHNRPCQCLCLVIYDETNQIKIMGNEWHFKDCLSDATDHVRYLRQRYKTRMLKLKEANRSCNEDEPEIRQFLKNRVIRNMYIPPEYE